MTTMVFLVRHAIHDLLHRVLAGRTPGIELSGQGRVQAERLGDRLAGEGIAAIYTSPLERARQTAAPIGRRLNVAVAVAESLNEIDFGAWSGHPFASLHGDPGWVLWNRARSLARPPGGETMLEAQARAVAGLEAIRDRHRAEAVAVVSHGDVIRAVLAWALAMPLDAILRFEIGPASVSRLALGDGQARVLSMNEAVAA